MNSFAKLEKFPSRTTVYVDSFFYMVFKNDDVIYYALFLFSQHGGLTTIPIFDGDFSYYLFPSIISDYSIDSSCIDIFFSLSFFFPLRFLQFLLNSIILPNSYYSVSYDLSSTVSYSSSLLAMPINFYSIPELLNDQYLRLAKLPVV